LLSGGQKRRLSVGTALVAGAPVLALDEPTFGQDRARADELMDLLEGLSADGTTILVVTHDMQLVTEHAHRTIIIGDGRVVADAATAAVFADDALVRAAGLRQPPLRRAFAGMTRHPSRRRHAPRRPACSGDGTVSAAITDPWATADRENARALERINPLAKLAAPLPAMVLLVFTRDLATPLAFIVIAYVIVLLGARLTARVMLLLFVALPRRPSSSERR
jgi:ABC-type glutathione transport system ATPase component